jgi:hypothetical protein
MTTTEMVKKMLNESNEVKQSVGGTKQFRQVIEFVLLNSRYLDDEKMEEKTRTPNQIAMLVEENFDEKIINEAKSVYHETN